MGLEEVFSIAESEIRNSEDYQYHCRTLRELILNDFQFACQYFHYMLFKKDFLINPKHHHQMFDALMGLWSGEYQKLLINIPPGYSKSQVCVIYFAAWCFLHNPSCRFLHTSYADTLVERNSSYVKLILSYDQLNFRQTKSVAIPIIPISDIFPELKIAKGRNTKEYWHTTANGMFYAVPFGGKILGFHAGEMERKRDKFKFNGAILIDDPNKASEIHFDNSRKTVNNLYDQAVITRVVSEATPQLLIMQRLHQDDLTGHILEKEPDQWYHLKIPVLDEQGEPLWDNERFTKHSKKVLMSMKAADPIMFSGQYMQEPVPEEGGIIDISKFKRYDYDLGNDFDLKFFVIDCGIKDNE